MAAKTDTPNTILDGFFLIFLGAVGAGVGFYAIAMGLGALVLEPLNARLGATVFGLALLAVSSHFLQLGWKGLRPSAASTAHLKGKVGPQFVKSRGVL